MCNSILEGGDGLDEDALRRSGCGRDGGLDGRNKECWSCFRLFARDLLEIASSGSKMLFRFWWFATDLQETVLFLMASQGTPHKGVSCF